MKYEVNKKAIELIENSKMPESYFKVFEALYEQSKETNSVDTKFSLKWHDDKVSPETYCPVLVFRMVKKRILDKENKKSINKMKNNSDKNFIASIKKGAR